MSALAALYRLLLRAYPRDFRAEHAEEASRLFADACRNDWEVVGWRPAVRRILTTLVTVPRDGLAERLDRLPRPVFVLSGLGADVRHASRSIRRRPALTLAIIVTLAVGLGTNVAVFSVIDATLLRPLPYASADRVVFVQASDVARTRASDPRPSWTRRWIADIHALERVEWRVSRSELITGWGRATRARVMAASGGYLDAIGARPVIGRSLIPGDTQTGAPRVTVLSEGFWRQHFGATPEALGKTLMVGGVPHIIVGVVSDLESDVAGLTFRLATALQDGDDADTARTVAWLRVGSSFDEAQAELDAAAAIDDRGRTLRPSLSLPYNTFWEVPLFRATTLGFLGAAILVLAIAGVNVSHLFLAAGQERIAEIGVRRALGASTLRVARLLFVETMALAMGGAAVGLAVAWLLIRWLTSLDAGPQFQSRLESIHIDPLIVLYGFGMGCFVAVAFGLWPAIRSARQTSVPSEGGSRRSSHRRPVSSSVLMAAETGLSAVLLIVAGVVGHAFLSMQMAEPGFDADRLLAVRIVLPTDRYPTPGSRAAFFDRLADQARAIPGVEQFGIGYGAVPPSDFTAAGTITISGSSQPPADSWIGVGFVAPGYFSLMGVPLQQGSDFSPGDVIAAQSTGAVRPAIISRSMANRFWPSGGAMGALFQITDQRGPRRHRVIGVAGDVNVWGLLQIGCENCDPHFYLPIPDQRQYTDVLLRLGPGVAPPLEGLQAAIAGIDPDVPADDELQTAESSLSDFIRQPRFTASLFGAFAIIAVVLVSMGLSTIVSRAVALRTREMGIRLALGATPGSVQALVIKDGMRPALVGLAVGVPAALGVTHTARSLLYGLSPADPLTLVVAPVLLGSIVLGALALPALRATRVDPARTLRAD